jgi:replicative DNA helicase
MPTASVHNQRRQRDPFDVSHLVAEPAERQLLAGVLDVLDRDLPAGREIVGGLGSEMFHGDGTADVFQAVCEAMAAVAQPTRADVLTALRRSGHTQGTIPHTLLVDLLGDSIGTGQQAARLGREAAIEVRRLHERRQAVEAATLVVSGAGHPDDVGGLIRHLERVRAASDAAAGNRPLTLLDCVDAWAKYERTPVVPTGLAWFDGPTEGGLPIGGIVALVAYPQAGKSALALQLALAALVHDPKATGVWCAGEMATHGLGRRMACVASALLPDVEPITMRDAGRRTAAARAANLALCTAIGERLAVIEPPLTVERIEARVAATGAKLIVIDYLQLIRSPDRTTDRVHELDSIIGGIREMAIKRDCAVIVISSMAKSAGTSSRIGQFGKGTGEIDYAVELLYVGERDERDGEPVLADDGTASVTWRCRKARNLEPRDLVLRFDGAMQTYLPATLQDFASFAPRPGQ